MDSVQGNQSRKRSRDSDDTEQIHSSNVASSFTTGATSTAQEVAEDREGSDREASILNEAEDEVFKILASAGNTCEQLGKIPNNCDSKIVSDNSMQFFQSVMQIRQVLLTQSKLLLPSVASVPSRSKAGTNVITLKENTDDDNEDATDTNIAKKSRFQAKLDKLIESRN